MDLAVVVLAVLVLVLAVSSIYQYLVMRSALRIAEILYVMSRNVRAKAAEVRRTRKDVEIIEAHLFDIATSARTLLRSLGRSEKSIDPDPSLSLSVNGHRMSADSLVRLADNILYGVREESPGCSWKESIETALDRFMRKVPSLDREAARKILAVVASEQRGRTLGEVGAKKDEYDEGLFSGGNREQQ